MFGFDSFSQTSQLMTNAFLAQSFDKAAKLKAAEESDQAKKIADLDQAKADRDATRVGNEMRDQTGKSQSRNAAVATQSGTRSRGTLLTSGLGIVDKPLLARKSLLGT